MKKSRFSESQIVAILKEVELGAKVGETCRKHGVSEPTYYKWKSRFSGMTVPHLAQLGKVRDRHARELVLHLWYVGSLMPCVLHVSPALAPSSTSLRMPTICASLNLDFFM